MIRHHLSSEPIQQLHAVDPSEQGAGVYKPAGFWYEVDGDWRRWCASEMRGWLAGKFLYRLELGSERILSIRNIEEFDAFQRRFAAQRRPWPYEKEPMWADVRDAGYDGVEIAPYLWERRLHRDSFWCYGWDCASGVIWTPQGTQLFPEELILPKEPACLENNV